MSGYGTDILYSTSQAGSVNSLSLGQLNGILATLITQNVTVRTEHIDVPYGTLLNTSGAARIGAIGYYISYYNNSGNATAYALTVVKAAPEVSVSMSGATLFKQNSTEIVHVPILPGQKTYTVRPRLYASLYAGNIAQFSYRIQIAGTQVANQSVNSTTLNKSFSYTVPANETVTVRLDTLGNANYTPDDPTIIDIPTVLTNYVPITFTNSQSSGISDPFQLNVTVDSAAYKSYEDQNLDNVEFFYANGTLVPSWLEGNALNDQQATNLYTSANTVYYLSVVGPFLPASSSNTLYMGFAPLSTNLFDGVTIGAAPNLQCASGCPQTGYGQYDNGNNIFVDYFNGDTATSSFTVHSSYTLSKATGLTFGSTTIDAIKITGSGATKDAQFAYSIGVPQNGLVEEVNYESTTANNKAFLGIGDSLSLGSIQNAIGSYIPTTTVDTDYISGGTSHGASSGLASATENVWWYGTLEYPGASASSFSIGISSNLYPATFKAVSSVPITGASTLYITPLSSHTGTASVTFYYNWIRLRIYPPAGVMPSASFGSFAPALTTNFIESGLPTPFTWNVIYGGLLENSASNSNTISFSTNSGIFSYAIADQTISSNTYVPSPSSGTLGAGNTLDITFSMPSATCTISLNSNSINFGSLIPTSSFSPTNQIQDTNSGSANANILVSGNDWTSVSGNTFQVSNTLWSSSSGGSETAITNTITSTSIAVPKGGSADVYFGVNIPAAQAADVYSQTITVESSC